MSRKGQALIEALAGTGLSILFFISCLKLWALALNDLQSAQREREKQICEMSESHNCRADAGFVLVTMLMQLTVLVFAAQVLVAVFLGEEFKWKISSWCFESGIAAVTAQQDASTGEIKTIEDEANLSAPALIRFRTFIKGPFSSATDNGSKESYYEISWNAVTSFSGILSGGAESTSQMKCGARKSCHDKKCTYRLIADRS